MSNAQGAANAAVKAANNAAKATATAANALANAGAAAPVLEAANQTALVAAANAANATQVAAANANKMINNAAEPLLANVPEELADAVAPPDDAMAEHVFTNVIKFGKFAFLAVLLILSFINGHKEYIAEKPRKFMWDSFAVGVTSAAAISIIAWMRGRADLIPNLAFITFFLFFTFNVFRELSGFNRFFSEEGKTQGEEKQVKAIKLPGIIIFSVGMAVLIAMAVKAKVAHPMGLGRLFQEALVLSVATAIGEMVVAINHGEKGADVILTSLLNLALFFVGHVLMQYGGFYNHVFSASGPSHDPIEKILHED